MVDLLKSNGVVEHYDLMRRQNDNQDDGKINASFVHVSGHVRGVSACEG